MLANNTEENAIRHYLTQALSDLTMTNTVRLKAGLRILMTTDQTTFHTICSNSIQKDLHNFVALLEHPERLAPISCETSSGRQTTLAYIKKFTLNHLSILDNRTTILPSAMNVRKTLFEDEHLKSVVHTSAIHNVVNLAYFREAIEKNFKKEGLEGNGLEFSVNRATKATARLHDLIFTGDIHAIEEALATPGIDINLANQEGLPLLHIAVREGFLDIVHLLLKVPDVQVNLVSNSGWTPLQLAARLGDSKIVKALLDAPGIKVNLASSDGFTALHWAAWHGNTAIVTQLLEFSGIEVNPRDKYKNTPLHWAARNGQEDVITLLLDMAKIEVNPIDTDHKTPIYYAVNFEHVPATAVLVADKRIDVNIQDIDGLSPLHWAARNGRLDLVNLLLTVPNIRRDLLDNNNMRPIDWAEQMGFTDLLPVLRGGPLKHPWLHKLKKKWQEVAGYFRSHLTTEP